MIMRCVVVVSMIVIVVGVGCHGGVLKRIRLITQPVVTIESTHFWDGLMKIGELAQAVDDCGILQGLAAMEAEVRAERHTHLS